jgi:hypothetical protein
MSPFMYCHATGVAEAQQGNSAQQVERDQSLTPDTWVGNGTAKQEFKGYKIKVL